MNGGEGPTIEKEEFDKKESEFPFFVIHRKYQEDQIIVEITLENPRGFTLSNGSTRSEMAFEATEKEGRKKFEDSEKILLLGQLNSTVEGIKYRTTEIVRNIGENGYLGSIRCSRLWDEYGYLYTMNLEGRSHLTFSNGQRFISRYITVADEKKEVHDEDDERHQFQNQEFDYLRNQLAAIGLEGVKIRSVEIKREFYKKGDHE